MRYEMTILGMTCSHCQGRVLRALQEVSGVLAAEVNLEQGTAWIDVIDSVLPERLIDVVEDWGYQVSSIDKKQKSVLPE